ncbi:alpha/beta hydrolase [Alkalicaulis satelles]|uniref:Alpha/beta hydrolase n=1 Tax=Alkalicaulis satelles TaxID=2609175 RepID=A0A5M6ZA19_9PROT|nr:alpha/beta fold hydrolase [Alkalicaulis satelles]KAA5800950.1 alpha/beta hydrolase [Alkalicaulis satelles]
MSPSQFPPPQAPLSLEDWRAGGSYFGYRGHQIFQRTGGDWRDEARPVLILIHGFPTASWDWVHQWEALCERFRVAAIDMIGFGFSDKPARYDYSIQDQADLHETWLDRLGVSACHILAHDYGDTVAQELLARVIDRRDKGLAGLEIVSVCFLNGGLFPEQHRATFTQRLLHSPIGPLLSRMMTRKRFETGLCEVFGPDTQPTKETLDAFWALATHGGGMPRIGHKLIRYIAERRATRERWVGALVDSPVPLRVIDGALDPVSGAHMVEHYQKLVPNPDTVLIAHAGHYPQLEAPGEVLDAFLQFQSAMTKA